MISLRVTGAKNSGQAHADLPVQACFNGDAFRLRPYAGNSCIAKTLSIASDVSLRSVGFQGIISAVQGPS
jgi:hypothetical protein